MAIIKAYSDPKMEKEIYSIESDIIPVVGDSINLPDGEYAVKKRELSLPAELVEIYVTPLFHVKPKGEFQDIIFSSKK